MKNEFQLSYVFNTTSENVFNAFGNADALNAWWGPVECENTVISLDFRKGGIFHFKMEMEGQTNYGRFLFGNIRPYDLIEFTNAFADENANVIKAPFDMEIPDEIFYRITLTESNGQTELHLTGQPVNATAAQQAGFNSINESMQQGFAATFDMLKAYLNF